MFSVLKGGDGGDCLIMPDLCHLTSDSEGRRTDRMPSLCCAVVQCPDDASGLDVGAHAVGHRRIAKGSGCGADALRVLRASHPSRRCLPRQTTRRCRRL